MKKKVSTTKNTIVNRSVRILAGSIAAFFAAQSASAAIVWSGTTDNVFATGTNWVGGIAPVSGDTATFSDGGNGNTTVSLGAGATVNAVLFDTASAAAYTIGSGAVNSQPLTLNNGGAITLNSTIGYNQLFNSSIILGDDGTTQNFTLTNNSLVGGLVVAGTITGSTGAGVKTIAVAGAGATTLNGIIGNGTTGTVALTKSDAGRLTLSGNNGFTGGVTLNAGILRATTSTGALGAGTLSLGGGNLQLANDSGLNFGRNTTVTANTLINSDRLAAGAGVTHTLGTLAIGAQTLSIGQGSNVNSGTSGVTFGATTLSGAAVLNLGFGTLTTLGAITDAGNTLTLQGGGNFAQNAAWASGTAGGLTLDTSYRGTATLNQANTFTGTVTVKSGFHTLVATSNAGALGTGAAALDLQGGFLDLRNDTGLAFNRNTTVNGNSTIIAERANTGAGVTHTLGTLNMNGAYTLTVRGTNVNAGTAGLTFGATTLGGATTFDTFNPSVYQVGPVGNVQLTLGAVTGAGFTLTKNGSGTLRSAEVSGTPFGDGNIALNGGTLLLAPGTSGANAVTGVNVAEGSTFTYRSGTVQLTKNGTSLDYTIGHASAAADSVLVRSSRGTLVIGATALANLGTTGTERFLVNGQTTATNKNGVTSPAGIYDASVVGQEGTGNTGIGSFLVADTVANGGFVQTAYTARNAAVVIPANEITNVTGSFTATTLSNPYALRVGAFTLTNGGTTTVNGVAAGTNSSGIGGVILNPTATASIITGGTLDFGASEGAIYVGSGGGFGSIASNITGSAGLTKFGPGKLTLSGTTNNYTGGTVINGGTLAITTDAQIGAVPGSFDASNITINGGGTLDISANITLSANRGIVLGPGMQTFTATANSPHIAGVISGTGGLYAYDQGGGGGRGIYLDAANTYSGDTVIAMKQNVDSGLRFGHPLTFQNSTVDYNSINTRANVLKSTGMAVAIFGGLKGDVQMDLNYQTNASYTITNLQIGNNSQDTNYSGIISSTGNSGNQGNQGVTKIGSGSLVLTGASSFFGYNTVNSGTLVIGAATTISGNTLINGGTLQVAHHYALQNSAIDTTGTGTLSFATGIDAPTFGGLMFGGNFNLPSNITGITLNPFTGTNTVTGAPGIKYYTGILSSATAGMSVTKTSATGQILTGANTYSGNTILTGAGAIYIGADATGTLGNITNSPIGKGGLVFNGGALAALGSTARTILNPVTFTGNITLGDNANNGKLTFSAAADLGAATRTLTLNSDAQFDGVITSGATFGITKAGYGILTLGATNAYSGPTTINYGIIRSGASNVIPDVSNVTLSPNQTGGAIVTLNLADNSDTIGTLSFGGSNVGSGMVVSTGTGTLTLGGDVTYTSTNNPLGATISGKLALGAATRTFTIGDSTTTASDTLISAVVSGTGVGLTKAGAGTLVLSATNTYDGVTTISAGTLQLGTGITGQNGSVVNASIVNGGTLTFNNADAQSYLGVISSSGALNKLGAGTLTLSGNNSYGGATSVSQGRLILDYTGGTGILPDTTALTLGGGVGGTGAIELQNGTGVVDAVASFTLSAGASSITRTSGTSQLNIGAITRSAGGTLNVTDNVVLTSSGSANSILTAGAGIYATVGGTDWAAKDGANSAIVGYSTVGSYSATTINNLGGSGNQSDVAAGIDSTINTESTSTLRFNQNEARTITLNAAQILTLTQGGLLVTSNVNPATGTTTITGGTLKPGGNDALQIIQNSPKGLTINSVIANGSGASALTKSGTGTLTLGSTNTYTGTTFINEGKLAVTHATDTIPNGSALTINGSTAIFDLGANRNDTVAAVTLDGGGQITGSGTSTLTGSSYALRSGTITSKIGTGTITKSTTGSVALDLSATTGTTALGAVVVNTGSLTFTGGKTITSGAFTLGNAAADVGASVTVTGTGTSLTTLNFDMKAGSGHSLTVSSGAAVTLGQTGVWFNGGASNENNGQSNTTVTVTGLGSTLAIGGGLAVDWFDRGTGSRLIINNGGVVNAAGLNYFGYFAGANNNSISVDGSGSVWNLGALQGSAPAGVNNTITASNFGRIAGTSTFSLGLSGTTGNTLNILSGGQISVNGALNASLTGNVVNLGDGGAALSVSTALVNSLSLAGTNSLLNFNNGRLVANTTGNLVTGSGLIQLNGAAYISSTSGFTSTITSTIVGSGSLTKEDAGTLVLNAINDYTGNTVVNGGVLIADATNFSTGARAPLNSATALTLSNGTFRFTGTQGLSRTQVVNGLTLNPGANVVDANHVNTFTGFASTPTTTIDLSGAAGTATITRNAGATLDFRATTGAYGTTAIVKSAQANMAGKGILGAWATVNSGADLAANNGSNVIVAYAGYTALDAQAGGANGTVADATNANYRINAAGTSGSVPIAGAVTNVNTLSQNIGTASTIDTSLGILRVGTAGGVLITPSGQNLTIGTGANSGTLTAGGNADDVAGDLVLANFSGNTLTVNSTIANNGTGAVTVSKTGSGNVVLAGTNTYTGTTFVNAGTLTLNTSNVIGTGGVTVNGGTLAMGTNSDSVGAVALTAGGITGSGASTLTSTSGFTFTNPGAVTISTALAGSVGITKSARGTVTLNGASTFSGATAVNEGVLAAGVVSVANTSGAFGNNSAITMGTALSAGLNITGFNTQIGSLTGGGYGAGGVILGAATLSVGGNGTSPAAYLGPISGTGNVTKIGSGTWTVSGNSSYTGVTKIDNGTLNLGFRIANGGIASSMGQSSNAADRLVIGGGTLKYSGSDAATTDRLFTIGSPAGETAAIDASGSGTATLAFTNTGSIAFGNTNDHTLTLTGTNTGANSLAAVIGDNTGATSLVKDGAGKWTVSASSGYTGSTTINNGNLVVSGTLSGTTAVSVTGGALEIAAADRINNAATVTMSSGTFKTGGFNETVGAFTLSGTATIDLGAGASILQLANSSANTWSGGLSITNWSGTQLGGGTDQIFFGTDATGLTAPQIALVSFVNPAGFGPGTYGATQLGTGELVVVPEPGAAVSLLGGLGLLLGMRRRRKQ